MRVYETKPFARFARRNVLSDRDLRAAAAAVVEGLYDADLGGGVFKQRVARAGGGKSGGFRIILLFRAGSHVFLVRGFAKSERANVTGSELLALRRFAAQIFRFSDADIQSALRAGALIEVKNDE